ncbi:putative phosphofructokinase [Cryptosporidium felis]|nr:putative phosphofructokinase [Cryptosporidium felis]
MSTSKQTELKRIKGEGRDFSLLSASSLEDGQSNMQIWRKRWEPCLPHILRSPVLIKEVPAFEGMREMERSDVSSYFPLTSGNKLVKFEAISDGSGSWGKYPARRIGVVLSGGQASGGHNVIAGIMSYIKLCNPSSQLFGFLGGPEGVYSERFRELTEEDVAGILNQGGFNVICSGRHKIETEEQMRASLEICEKLRLHGLVVVGGDDSNTNAAVLAEYFKRNSSSTVVVGCPKTIDGDLKNEVIETSFGYDTAVKTYSEQIGSLMDAMRSEKNGYYFVRLMGRSASHITLECGLQTRANLILIGEEIKQENRSLMSIVDEIVEMMVSRESIGKPYGIILLPEGLVEFIPEFEALIGELNLLLLKTGDKQEIVEGLTQQIRDLFLELPLEVQNQLLLERDPHGNVQVAKIATEELLVYLARERLERLGKAHLLRNVKTHYFGYEGRCALPSNFDASYCFALGYTAAALIDDKRSGYMAVVRGLSSHPELWEPAGCPLTYMMNMELRKGKLVPVIKKYLVDLKGEAYKAYCQVRPEWKLGDFYRSPGPIQFEGPSSGITNYMISPPSVEDLLSTGNKTGPMDKPRIPKVLTSSASKFSDEVEISHLQGDLALPVSRLLPHQTEKHKLKALLLNEEEDLSGLPKNSPLSPSAERTLSGESLGLIIPNPATPGVQSVIYGLISGLPSLKELAVFKSIQDFLTGRATKVSLASGDYLKFLENSLNAGGCVFPNAVEVSPDTLEEKKGSVATLKPSEFSPGSQDGDCIRSCRGLLSNDSLLRLLTFHNIGALAIVGDNEAVTLGAELAEQLACISCMASVGKARTEIPVVLVPCCLENSISHPLVEACVGFDSVTKSISTLVGNLLTDSASATKYWYFMRTIGRQTSNIALEVSIQTHPDVVVIPERYGGVCGAAESSDLFGVTLDDIVTEVCDLICTRSNRGKNFGGLVVSEGLFDQVYPTKEYRELVRSGLMGKGGGWDAGALARFEKKVVEDFNLIFEEVDARLVEDLKLKSIEQVQTEVLLSSLVQKELRYRKSQNKIKSGMSSVCFNFSDQVRACRPSEFDSSLGTVYGALASKIIRSNLVGGYAVGARGILDRLENWKLYAVPVSSFMTLDFGSGKPCKGLVSEEESTPSSRGKKLLVGANGRCSYEGGKELVCKLNSVNTLSNPSFRLLMAHTEKWELENAYANPGPIQFHGVFKHIYNRSLFENEYSYIQNLKETEKILLDLKQICQIGVEKGVLSSAVHHLKALQNSISIIESGRHCGRAESGRGSPARKQDPVCGSSSTLLGDQLFNDKVCPESIVGHILHPGNCN